MLGKKNTGLPDIPIPFALLVIALLSLCFASSYDGNFVFDDIEAVVNNDDVQATPISEIFRNDFWGNKLAHKQSHRSYRPFTVLTYRLQYWIREKLVPQDYHIVNLILNTIVCMLMLPTLLVLLGPDKKKVACYTTMLFTVHPVHAETVAGIVGRTELLCALFMWLSIFSYSYCIYAKRRIYNYGSFIVYVFCIILATLSKETGITVMGVCAVYDAVVVNQIYPIDIIRFPRLTHSYAGLKKMIRTRRNFLIRLHLQCLIAIWLLFLRFSLMKFQPPTFHEADNPTSFMENVYLRMINYSYIYSLNIWLLICPEWLCFDWSMGCVPLITGYDWRMCFALIFWISFGAFIAVAFSTRKKRYLGCWIMGLSILIIPFLPASNIFFRVGFVVAERTLYIPSAGYCLLLVLGLRKLFAKISPQYAVLPYIVLILLFFTRSWIRSGEWRTEATLFQTGLQVCPLNAKVHYNIAKTAGDAGNNTLARYGYKEAIRLYPKYAQAMNNLGNLLKTEGRYGEAEALFRTALRVQRDFAAAWMNLGIVLSDLKRYKESETCYLTAINHRLLCPDCFYNLGVLYMGQGRYTEALLAWETTIEQKRTHRRAWRNLIILFDDLNLLEEALKIGNEALKFIPGDAPTYFNMANVLGKQGRYVLAEKYYKIAISKTPTDPKFYANLGVLYHLWNKFDEAERMYKKALSLEPGLKSPKDNLKKLYALKKSIN